MTNETALSFENVSFHYERDYMVLENFSFTLGAGRRVAIVGSSGCGKSTLLGLVTGRLTPTRGKVSWNISTSRPHGAYGLINQGDGLLPWRTVEENILAGARMSVKPGPAELLKGLERLGLPASTLSVFPGKLSVGMRKRVEILRALATPTGLLLADEPFAALDLNSAERAADLIDAKLSDWGGALLMVTHDLQSAIYRGDEILVFTKAEPGKIALHANPAKGLPSDDPVASDFLMQLAHLTGTV